MQKYDSTWSDINNLLSLLHSTHTVDLVRQFYARYGNDAPPILLEDCITKVQKRLDNAAP